MTRHHLEKLPGDGLQSRPGLKIYAQKPQLRVQILLPFVGEQVKLVWDALRGSDGGIPRTEYGTVVAVATMASGTTSDVLVLQPTPSISRPKAFPTATVMSIRTVKP